MKFLNQKTSAAILSLALLGAPMFAFAAGGLLSGICPDAPNCTFNDLILLANTIVKFLLYSVSIPLVAIVSMLAGAKMILGQDKAKARSEAKASFLLVAEGFGIMLGSYILIKTVLFFFLSDAQKNFMQFMFK